MTSPADPLRPTAYVARGKRKNAASGVAPRSSACSARTSAAHIGPYGGPLLLTHPTMVPDETRKYLESVSPVGGSVYGGTHAMNEDTFDELEALIGHDE